MKRVTSTGVVVIKSCSSSSSRVLRRLTCHARAPSTSIVAAARPVEGSLPSTCTDMFSIVVLFLLADYPRVLSMPTRMYLPRGMTGRIDCPAEANPPVTLTVWSKDERTLDLMQNNHIKVNKHGTLVIRTVLPTDEGHYSCTPYSTLGEGERSIPIHVLVRGQYSTRNRLSSSGYSSGVSYPLFACFTSSGYSFGVSYSLVVVSHRPGIR